MKPTLPAFTLIEVMVVIAILAILSAATFLIFNPQRTIDDSQEVKAVNALKTLAQAVQLNNLDNGYYPPDQDRGIPFEIQDYLPPEFDVTEGPFPGSVWDYDNWLERDCIGTDNDYATLQVTLRQIPDRNPDGSDTWAWYYVIQGEGTAHCNNSAEHDLGECVNCPGFEISY